MSLKDAIREAAGERDKQEQPQADSQKSNKAVNAASNKAVKQALLPEAEPSEELAGLTVRVSRRHRLHWLIAAKKQRTTLTAAITEALNACFGEPTD